MSNHRFLLGEWKLVAISGNVRGDVWWHAAVDAEEKADGFGKLQYTCENEINHANNSGTGKKKKEMSVEFEIHLKDVKLTLNECERAIRGRFLSRAITMSYFLSMKMSLRVFRFIALLCVPTKKLSQKMFYAGTYADAEFVSTEGTAFENPLFMSPDDDNEHKSITGYVEHDIAKCSENIKEFTQKEMRSRNVKKDVRDTELLLVRKFHLSEDKNVLTLITPNDSTSDKPGMQLKWRRIAR